MKNSLLLMFILLVFPFLLINFNEKNIKLEEKSKNILNKMTLNEKIGQMFFVRHPIENQIEDIKKYHLGGYLFYSRDFKNENPITFKNRIISYQKSSRIPLLIGVDEEGGNVVRVSKYNQFRKKPFKSSKNLYLEGGFKAIENDTKDKCSFLKNLGINTNFAPVVDISKNVNDYIYDRTIGLNKKLTSDYANKVVKVMEKEKVVSVLKHFPGYSNNADTHQNLSYDNRSLSTFKKNDFWPFVSGIEAGAEMVLVSHNIISKIDSKPASISLKIHQILKDNLNFNGVIITDALDMSGLLQYLNGKSPAVVAILAGNDMLCTTDYQKGINDVKDAVVKGIINEKRIDESVLKIIEMKIKMEIINQ